MVEELRQALDALGALPEEDQRHIAQRVLEEIEQREWDALVSSPRSKAFLQRLIAEAKDDDLRSDT
jgi:hypothetical protein